VSDIDKVLGSYEHAIQAADWADTTEALAVVERARLELANLRRRAQGVDVEAASRAIDNAILLASVYDGVAIDKDKVMADLAALRRALTRADEKDERASGKEPAP